MAHATRAIRLGKGAVFKVDDLAEVTAFTRRRGRPPSSSTEWHCARKRLLRRIGVLERRLRCVHSPVPLHEERYYQREKTMKANVGNIDRAIRIIIGLGLVGATLMGAIGAWGWLGLLPLATGIFRFCPAYLPFGLRTCGGKK